MTETWIWDPGQEDDTRSSDGTGARCCTLPHPQKREDLALRPVQAGNPTNRVPGNSVVARVSLGQCGGVCDGTQWAAGRALPRSPAADATDASTPIPANPRTHAAVPPRSPGSASVPRRAILRPNPPSYPTSRGPTNPVGTNHDGHHREPQPPQHAPDEEVEPGATRANCAESNPGDDQITRRYRKRRRWQRFTSNERATPCPHAAPAHGPPEAPRSPAGRFCSQIRPRTQPPGDQPTPKGPPVAEGSGEEPDHNVRRAEGSRTTTSGERSTAVPVGTGTTQPHTQLGAWGWFRLTPQTGCATRPPRAARQSSSGRHAPAGTGWQQPRHQQEDLDRKWI